MVKNQRVIKVFVGSPSDVEEERSKLEEVIRELNITWSEAFDLRLDLIRWETHAYPDIGEDAQDVINQQIGDDYDIFIGIMWTRFGTPTGRAGSGTEEEFQRAKNRYDKNPETIRIMFYFKDSPVSISKLDPSEIKKIQDFKSSFSKDGALYWNFSNVNEFERFIRMHLSKQIQRYLKTDKNVKIVRPEKQDEEGLIDLMDKFENKMNKVTEALNEINEAIDELGTQISQRAQEINNAKMSNLNRGDSKHLINKAANNMMNFVYGAKKQTPIFEAALKDGLDAFSKIVSLTITYSKRETSEIEQRRDQLEDVLNNLDVARKSLADFKDIVADLPRMTTVLNNARRETIEAISGLIEPLDAGHRDIVEIIQIIDSITNT
jgi:hypothetical protein